MARDESFDRTRRVRKRRDFLRIQSSRRKVRTDHLLLAISPQKTVISGSLGTTERPAFPGAERTRLGITVTTKIDKRAARRNRLKRRIREFFRREHHRFRETVDLVVIALEGATELDYAQVAGELKRGFDRAGLYRSSRPYKNERPREADRPRSPQSDRGPRAPKDAK
ncbi:MAG: ribonuclease P protein component [Bdellovibrionota bacterium]